MSNELSQFDQLKSDIVLLVQPVKSLTVTDFRSAQAAIETGNQVRSYIKRLEKVRTDLVGPLNARVKEINTYAKSIESPLEDAQTFIKKQLQAFEIEQEKIRAEAQRLADEERRKKEAEILAKQEAERAALEVDVASQARAAALFGADETEIAIEDTRAELEQKQTEERAIAAGEARVREYDIKQHGVKGARKEWKCEVIDMDLVPKEFLIRTLNSPAVLAAARGGMTSIPGIKVWQETKIAFGANTYIPRKAIEEVG